MSVSVLEYGIGNVGSVLNMLKRLDADPVLVRTPDEILAAERLLIPGVGSFDRGMAMLAEPALDDAIREFAPSGNPILGICLGMQLLLDGSDEGSATGLGLIPGHSVRFPESDARRVPHMGWNRVAAVRSAPILSAVPEDNRFYFVHSFHVIPADDEDTLATTEYGVDFSSMVQRENVIGAQFHPEKSHLFGMELLRSFAQL